MSGFVYFSCLCLLFSSVTHRHSRPPLVIVHRHPRSHVRPPTRAHQHMRTHTYVCTREWDWDGDIGIKNFIIEKRGGFRRARAEMDWIKRTKGLFYRSLSWKRHWVTRPRRRWWEWREVLCKRNKWIHLLFKAQGVMVGCHFGPEK